MPHCPRCEKRFKTDEKVTRHLNQPRSSCANLIDDLISPKAFLSKGQSPLPERVPDSFDMDLMGTDNFTAQVDQDVKMATQGPEYASDTSNSVYRENFDSAAKEWGFGSTFMGRFDCDESAYIRQENLYYPFASKADWELAAFLLRSRLSMAMIDDFLGLQLVSILPMRRETLSENVLDSHSAHLISISKGVERSS